MVFNFSVILKHVALCLVCLIGDKLSDAVEKPPLLRACIDNCTHVLIGLIASEIFLNGSTYNTAKHEYLLLLCEAAVVSSLIDLDHFIEARSFRLQDATNLDRRPFLHNSVFCILIFLLLIIVKPFGTSNFRLSTAVAFIAFSTHHMRDATRRGIWIKSPFQDDSSRPIPYVGYLVFTNILPHVMTILVRSRRLEAVKDQFMELV
ncbi:transmembrane protein 267 [Anopheles ziemanni]|uniref:transmembrane protein 267 n=1 Tax=Anopheles coustani TaxID=139045 RepID=UPI002659C0EF|nr:transmembrane protein 267 [Anopheles coustani]XP_058167006.1 transmembrane protein 267 [Anopheles ziemanni]